MVRIILMNFALLSIASPAWADPVPPGAQAALPSPYASPFGFGLASDLGRTDTHLEIRTVPLAGEKRLKMDREYVADHAKSDSDVIALARKCRRIIAPPSYCELPEMQQLSWANSR